MLIERLCKQTGLTRSQIDRYAETASKRYKTYPIDKRDGTERLISQPSREIKAIQRWLIRVVFRAFPVHQAATAYSKGSSIRANANRHVESNFTLRVDFEDFFPSFSSGDVQKFLRAMNDEAGLGLSDDDILFSTRIVSRFDALTIGAPSSPILTNTMMFAFDEQLALWSAERNVVYTRYADDIFLSSRGPDSLADAMKAVLVFSKDHAFGNLRINNDKTVFLTRRARRSVTGLVITPDRKISIGRERKRQLKTLMYLQTIGMLDVEKLAYLRGMLAFISDVEPTFRESLSRKFGNETLDNVEGRKSAVG